MIERLEYDGKYDMLTQEQVNILIDYHREQLARLEELKKGDTK